MSDQEVILRALELVRRRLRLTRALHDGATVWAMIVVAVLLWRVLHLFAGRAPAVVAVAVLAALLLWVAGLFLLARSVLVARCTLDVAATSADARAGLKDELTTAHWFVQHPIPSPWIDAQVARAARSARDLNAAALFPLRLERRELVGAAAAVLLIVAAWLVPPLAPPSDASVVEALPEAQAAQVQLLRELIGQTRDEATAKKLQQALDVYERKTATGEEKQRALSEAQRAIEQQEVQAASRREGLYRLADKLRGNKRLEEVARALGEGDAAGAARSMQQVAGSNDSTGHQDDAASSSPGDEEQELERLLNEAARGEDQAEQNGAASAAGRQAVDRLQQIAQQLEVQDQLSQAARTLQRLQLAVAQRSQLSAGRFGRQAAQNSTPAPESGQTSMPGGMMFRTTAVARETTASEQQESSKTGSALGDSRADPVLGAKVTPLAVQLKQEAIAGQRQSEDQGTAKSWFYADSRQQKSTLELEDVRAAARFTLGQSAALDGVSVRHRQIVKDYFTAQRQDAPP
ncbi:MAG TPA: hypothetical protein VMH26_17855 [Burkholderiales bacterium]|nr:hypothetical protein [Burkholderiales bacterium]